MQPDPEARPMSSRALLTNTDREALRGNLDSNKKTSSLARIRDRIDGLDADGQLLREYSQQDSVDEDLYGAALQSFLPEDPVERLAVLRQEIERVEEDLQSGED